MPKKALATIMTVILAMGICPLAGFADTGKAPLTSGSTPTKQATVTTQASKAKKVNVWVRSQMKTQTKGNPNWPATTYKYDKNGLLTSRAYYVQPGANSKIKVTEKYKYNSKGLRTKVTWSDRKDNYTFAYDKKGRMSKSTFYNAYYKKKYTTAYQYKTGSNPITVKENYSSQGKTDSTGHYDYYKWHTPTLNKKNRLTKLKTSYMYKKGGTWKKDGEGTTTYTYDKHGNITKSKSGSAIGHRSGSATTFKNTYGKSGRLAKRKSSSGSYTQTHSYTYKKISVPAKYASIVKRQQYELINPTAHNFTGWY